MTRILMTTVAALSFTALAAQPSFAGSSWSQNNTNGGFSCGSGKSCASATGYTSSKAIAAESAEQEGNQASRDEFSATHTTAGGSARAEAAEGGAADAENDSRSTAAADTNGDGNTAASSTSNSNQTAAANGGSAN